MVELRLAWLAEDFWGVGTGAGAVAYPVDMAEAIGWRLPLDVRPVPHLHTVHLHGYARRLGIEPLDAGPERRLRGCLLARRGRGIVFVDSADTADEQRFTLAHEVAHFLVEYEQVRASVRTVLGPEALAVLDGERPPTRDERLAALLGGVRLGVHTHLMERGADGDHCARVAEAECTADALALELLAPEHLARDLVAALPDRPYHDALVAASAALRVRFGLPEPVAAVYARWLVDWQTGGVSFREWLGIRQRR